MAGSRARRGCGASPEHGARRSDSGPRSLSPPQIGARAGNSPRTETTGAACGGGHSGHHEGQSSFLTPGVMRLSRPPPVRFSGGRSQIVRVMTGVRLKPFDPATGAGKAQAVTCAPAESQAVAFIAIRTILFSEAAAWVDRR